MKVEFSPDGTTAAGILKMTPENEEDQKELDRIRQLGASYFYEETKNEFVSLSVRVRETAG